MKGNLPSRYSLTHLVFGGTNVKIIYCRGGSALEIFATPNDLRLPKHFAFFKTILTHEFSPEQLIAAETINGQPTYQSPYTTPFSDFGFKKYHNGLELTKRY